MRHKTIESLVRSYWRDEIYLTDLVLTLISQFNTKIVSLRRHDCSLFDMNMQEHLTVLRPNSRLGPHHDRRAKLTLETWGSDKTKGLLQAVAIDVIDAASMHELGIDVERSVFSLQVDHLAYLPAE